MGSEQKKLIFNPVLAAPWKTQKRSSGSPTAFPEAFPMLQELGKRRRGFQRPNQTINIQSLAIRQQNIESLIMRFPGLKKYQAKAALTMSHNQLDKAIVLLEVSHCYRKEVMEKKDHIGYLKNVHINLHYDIKEQDPTMRNIVFETSICRRGSETDSSLSSSSSVEKTNDRDRGTLNDREIGPLQCCERGRVGVVILKTSAGYTANLL